MITISLVLLLIALFLEISVSSLPLVLLVLIVLTIIYRSYTVFILAFIFGIMLDILTLKTVGISSLFLISLIFLILVYEKKFEIKTNYFVILASVLGSFFFLLFFGYNNIISQTLVSVIIGVLIFQVINRLNMQKTVPNS